jgi:hypothetical protein
MEPCTDMLEPEAIIGTTAAAHRLIMVAAKMGAVAVQKHMPPGSAGMLASSAGPGRPSVTIRE